MRRILKVAGLVGLILSVMAASAHSGTDQEKFEKLIAKSAPHADDLITRFKPKFGCTCVRPPGVFEARQTARSVRR
jgi:hypothetical protein